MNFLKNFLLSIIAIFSVFLINTTYAQEDTQNSSKTQILGCTNSQATNYNNQATEDDGTCVLPPPKIP